MKENGYFTPRERAHKSYWVQGCSILELFWLWFQAEKFWTCRNQTLLVQPIASHFTVELSQLGGSVEVTECLFFPTNFNLKCH